MNKANKADSDIVFLCNRLGGDETIHAITFLSNDCLCKSTRYASGSRKSTGEKSRRSALVQALVIVFAMCLISRFHFY